jgi:hypothetical protein
VLSVLPPVRHPDLIVGLDWHDDAGVFRLGPDLAVIQTVDFFTPIVDDPFTFGEIAAANSLSDVYAMGGEPVTAMNIVGFPVSELDLSILGEILRGGHAMTVRAGALLVGGHSVKSPELFYGLSVLGRVHPDRVVTNAAARPGDALVLTKSIDDGLWPRRVEICKRDAIEERATLRDCGESRADSTGADDELGVVVLPGARRNAGILGIRRHRGKSHQVPRVGHVARQLFVAHRHLCHVRSLWNDQGPHAAGRGLQGR